MTGPAGNRHQWPNYSLPKPHSPFVTKQPVCWLTGFGDSSVDFVLRFWINDPREGLTNIRGKVLLAVWDTFQEHGIKIPFPHREVIMKTPVEVSGSALPSLALPSQVNSARPLP